MSITTVKVSDKGQIAIPRSVREKIGIEKGDELVLFSKGKKILLEKSDRIENSMKEDFEDILKVSERSLKEIWDNKADDIWGEYLK